MRRIFLRNLPNITDNLLLLSSLIVLYSLRQIVGEAVKTESKLAVIRRHCIQELPIVSSI